MTDKIRVNISTLSHELADMVNLARQARNNFQSMQQSIQDLHATWDGPAHDALIMQFDSDSKIMLQSLETLDKFLSSVEFARNEYRTCENNVSGKIDAIKV